MKRWRITKRVEVYATRYKPGILGGTRYGAGLDFDRNGFLVSFGSRDCGYAIGYLVHRRRTR